MSISLPNPEKKYSYHDYLKWGDEICYELINGVPYNMTPAPSRIHQRISRDLMLEIGNYLKGKKCEIYDAPFDVRLLAEGKENKDILDVVQPDLAVICDPSKLDDQGCNGSPDFIIEIISPGTGKHDRLRKYNLYEQAGVTEYWIVDPFNRTVEVFLLTQGSYERKGVYGQDDEVKVAIFDDLVINLNHIFYD